MLTSDMCPSQIVSYIFSLRTSYGEYLQKSIVSVEEEGSVPKPYCRHVSKGLDAMAPGLLEAWSAVFQPYADSENKKIAETNPKPYRSVPDSPPWLAVDRALF